MKFNKSKTQCKSLKPSIIIDELSEPVLGLPVLQTQEVQVHVSAQSLVPHTIPIPQGARYRLTQQ